MRFLLLRLMSSVPDIYSRLTKIAIRLEELESSIIRLEMEKEDLKREQKELREKLSGVNSKTDLDNWRANQRSTIDLLREEIGSDIFDV